MVDFFPPDLVADFEAAGYGRRSRHSSTSCPAARFHTARPATGERSVNYADPYDHSRARVLRRVGNSTRCERPPGGVKRRFQEYRRRQNLAPPRSTW